MLKPLQDTNLSLSWQPWQGVGLSNQDRMLIERLFAENLWRCCAGICSKLLCFRGDHLLCHAQNQLQQTLLPIETPNFEQFSAGVSVHWHLWDFGYTSDFPPLIARHNTFSIINCMAKTGKFFYLQIFVILMFVVWANEGQIFFVFSWGMFYWIVMNFSRWMMTLQHFKWCLMCGEICFLFAH